MRRPFQYGRKLNYIINFLYINRMQKKLTVSQTWTCRRENFSSNNANHRLFACFGTRCSRWQLNRKSIIILMKQKLTELFMSTMKNGTHMAVTLSVKSPMHIIRTFRAIDLELLIMHDRKILIYLNGIVLNNNKINTIRKNITIMSRRGVLLKKLFSDRKGLWYRLM